MAYDPNIRASDADRDRVATLLREHHAAGRLTAQEFSERLDKAFDSRTVGELDELLKDLPGIDLYRLPDARLTRAAQAGYAPPARRGRGGRGSAGWRAAWGGWFTVTLILLRHLDSVRRRLLLAVVGGGPVGRGPGRQLDHGVGSARWLVAAGPWTTATGPGSCQAATTYPAAPASRPGLSQPVAFTRRRHLSSIFIPFCAAAAFSAVVALLLKEHRRCGTAAKTSSRNIRPGPPVIASGSPA